MIVEAVADVGVIDEPSVAAAVLDPIRARVLSTLREPGSATTVAEAIGETRQKVNYHLRALERLGLVRLVEDRPRRGFTERVMVASARAYVLSPDVIGNSAVDPESTDRLSSNYVLALASRVVGEVADLARRAHRGHAGARWNRRRGHAVENFTRRRRPRSRNDADRRRVDGRQRAGLGLVLPLRRRG